MKFIILILISNYLSLYSVHPDDAPDIPAPFLPLYYLYSKHHNQLPRSDEPNIPIPMSENLADASGMFVLLSFLTIRLRSLREGILGEGVHDLYLTHPLVYEHSQHFISEQSSQNNGTEYRLSIHDNDIWSPKQREPLIYLLNDCLFCTLKFGKPKNFIETKVAAISRWALTIF